MIKHTIITSGLVGAVAGALALSFHAGRASAPSSVELAAQPEGMGQPSPEQIQAMMAATAAKAPEHDRLQGLVGAWDATITFLSPMGGAPEVSTMRAQVKPILDGRYVLSHYTGSFKYMGAEIPFEGYGMVGYDKAKGHYTSAWGDNMSTSMLVQTGPFEDGALDLRGEMPDGMGGSMKLRHRHVLGDDGSYTLEFYQPNRMTGEMAKIGWIEHSKE